MVCVCVLTCACLVLVLQKHDVDWWQLMSLWQNAGLLLVLTVMYLLVQASVEDAEHLACSRHEVRG